MSNNLKNETSPYLLQHAENPVNWYPWCDKAFITAKNENKPIFLSIGYSTCHWCHVMAHECFEDLEIAEYLNKFFISIKVDKEERPDIDSIYMNICQAFTGSGGWPMSIFITYEQKPFFAGTYFPKYSTINRIGFFDLIKNIKTKWDNEKTKLFISADEITKNISPHLKGKGNIDDNLPHKAFSIFKQTYDNINGGFGNAPKFPNPHNLLFLMDYYDCHNNKQALNMVENTLLQMYKGGIFDHIGYGFSRYSTDKYFLIPHFEKMLYDNALLLLSYTWAYQLTKNFIYKKIAENIADYVLRELLATNGGFYSAQDADSDGIEGKFYTFEYKEILNLLGEETGKKFNSYYGITEQGNFNNKNIPNLLNNKNCDDRFLEYLPKVLQYRKSRAKLHLDDKCLTSWNALMLSAFALMYKAFDEKKYLSIAEKSYKFIENNLFKNNILHVSYRNGILSNKGFLDDYSFYIFALLNMYEATYNNKYLDKAVKLTNKVLSDFLDKKNGGFFMYSIENEQLIAKPKETCDGAIPSGNSVMAYNLVKLSQITKNKDIEIKSRQQLEFMSLNASRYPAGYSFFLLALSLYLNPYTDIVCVVKDNFQSNLKHIKNMHTNIKILEKPTEKYKFLNNKTTFYVCKNNICLPPSNDLSKLLK